LPLKKNILEVRSYEAKKIIREYNELATETNEDREEIILKWYKPHSLNFHKKLTEKMLRIRNAFDQNISKLKETIEDSIKNIRFISLNYQITDLEKINLKKYIDKLESIKKINFDVLLKYLK